MPVHILIQSYIVLVQWPSIQKKKKKAMSFGMERKLENVKKWFILIKIYIFINIL